ncbi:hypothetical protein KDK77_11045 [bacterium]|nr:hypothetical protein [bacterium]
MMRGAVCTVLIMLSLAAHGVPLYAEPPHTEIALPPEEEKTAGYKIVEKIASGSERMRASINKAGLKTERAFERAIDSTAKFILGIDEKAESLIARIAGSEMHRSIQDTSRKTIDAVRASKPAEAVADTAKKAYDGVGGALNLPTQ